MDSDKVQVSVYCLAYNHEKYIRKTLDGFINQKTSFKYEVYVHDDASTDGTAAIIREYEQQYPDIIHGIYQIENQYSKDDTRITRDFLLPNLNGEYIACCEGDDYWCNSNKLQMQYDIMRNHRNIGLCVGKVAVINEDGSPSMHNYPATSLKTGIIDNETFIDLVCTDFFQLSSFFFRADAFKECLSTDYYEVSDVGDIPASLYLGSEFEGVYYIDEIVSCYRLNSVSSWNRRVRKSKEHLMAHRNTMIQMIDVFDSNTDNRFHSSCIAFKENEDFAYRIKSYDIISILKNRQYTRKFLKYSLKTKLSIFFKGCLDILGFLPKSEGEEKL